jgi:Formamidopyrimidine-DNA glycosylase
MPEMPEVETVRRGLMNIAAAVRFKELTFTMGKRLKTTSRSFGKP